MSFLRPGAVETLRRWGEPAIAGVTLALSLWYGVVWLSRGAVFGWLVLALAAMLAFWLRSALAGALARHDRNGPGVVVYREGEIGYMGPESGAFLEIGEIQRVEIVRASRGDLLWYLDGGAVGRLILPASAKGADRLVEALAGLPGFSDMTVAQRLRTPAPGRTVVWERSPRPQIESR